MHRKKKVWGRPEREGGGDELKKESLKRGGGGLILVLGGVKSGLKGPYSGPGGVFVAEEKKEIVLLLVDSQNTLGAYLLS